MSWLSGWLGGRFLGRFRLSGRLGCRLMSICLGGGGLANACLGGGNRAFVLSDGALGGRSLGSRFLSRRLHGGSWSFARSWLGGWFLGGSHFWFAYLCFLFDLRFVWILICWILWRAALSVLNSPKMLCILFFPHHKSVIWLGNLTELWIGLICLIIFFILTQINFAHFRWLFLFTFSLFKDSSFLAIFS